WTPVMPVPTDAWKAPKAHPKLGAPSMVHEYRDLDGNLLYMVYRLPPTKGTNRTKEHRPLCWCQNAEGKCQWRWKAPKPRPLFNMPTLRDKPEATVILVEGEKKVPAGEKLAPQYAWLSWQGGSGATTQTDWEPLRGRHVAVWPDNDAPGIRAATSIRNLLADIAASVCVLPPPAEEAAGWDVADAEAGGWTTDDVDAHIVEGVLSPLGDPRPSDLVSGAVPVGPLGDGPVEINSGSKNHFVHLGLEGKNLVYYSTLSSNIEKMPIDKMNGCGLIQRLAPQVWWERQFPGPNGPDYAAIRDYMMTTARQVGTYDASRVRRMGVWIDDDRIVVHLGDRLIVDGREQALEDLKSRYMYLLGHHVDVDLSDPLTGPEAAHLVDVLNLLNLEHKSHYWYLAGWMVVAIASGALDWRPHIWLTGQAGSGKSTILNYIVRPALGEFGLAAEGGTTEAGLRRELHSRPLAVTLDEAEARGRKAQEIVTNLLLVARTASSGEGEILKGRRGGSDDEETNQLIRSCFCLSSIVHSLEEAVDESRFHAITVVKHDDLPARERYRDLMSQLLAMRSTYWRRLRARTLGMWRTIRANIDTFTRALCSIDGDQRRADQTAPLLAGAYSLGEDNEISLEDAQKWALGQDIITHPIREAEPDEWQALNQILTSSVRVDVGGHSEDRNIEELIDVALGAQSDNGLDRQTARTTLKTYGILASPDDQSLTFAHDHVELKRLFNGSAYTRYPTHLARLPGAERLASVRFGGDLRKRGVRVSWPVLVDHRAGGDKPPFLGGGALLAAQ
ncbi:MAG: DUF6371 domain-containing protein, partial [Gemmatimonadota bacterium]